MRFSWNFKTFLVPFDLHTQMTCYLLYQLIPIRIYGSPATSLLSSELEKSICISWPGWVNTGSLIFLVDGFCYFKLLPELMHAVHVRYLFLMSFFILDHQNKLPFVSIFVEHGWPKWSASTNCFFNSWGSQFYHLQLTNPIIWRFRWKLVKILRGLFLSVCFSHMS